MSTIGGNNSIQDGLVFYYDTGNVKSFRGEPTINQANTDLSRTMEDVYAWQSGNVQYLEAPEKGPGWKKMIINQIGDNNNITRFPYINHPNNTHKTYSMEVDLNGLDDYYFFRCIGYGGHGEEVYDGNRVIVSYSVSDGGGYQALSLNTLTQYRNTSGLGHTIYYRNYQVENKTYATPFTPTQRTATESLYDLKGKSFMDVTNTSFNSDGLYFDSSVSSSFLDSGFGAGLDVSTNPITIEAVVKLDDNSSNRMWVDATNNGTNQRLYGALGDSALGIQDSGWSGTISPHLDWSHQVIVMDGSNATKYSNTIPTITKTYTPYTLVGNLNFGGRNTFLWDGLIPIAKIYNRALTPEEIKRNYNSYKSRFNLS